MITWNWRSPERTDRGIRSRRVFQADALNTLRDAAIDQFVSVCKRGRKIWQGNLLRQASASGTGGSISCRRRSFTRAPWTILQRWSHVQFSIKTYLLVEFPSRLVGPEERQNLLRFARLVSGFMIDNYHLRPRFRR